MAINFQQLNTDFQQRYEGSYIRIRFPNTTDKIVFYVEKITLGKSYPLLHLINDTFGRVQLNYDSETDMFFKRPKTGYFWYQQKVALFYRKLSLRQWRRGVCLNNSQITSDYSQMIFIPTIGLNTECLDSAYKREIIPFPTAYQLIKTQQALSVPFSYKLAVGLNVTEKTTPIIWFETTPIAEIHNEGTIILVHEKHFMQEIMDFVHKEKINARII